METSQNQSIVTENPGIDDTQTAAIFDIMDKMKATARVKQRSVENLIESAQSTMSKVLQRFNDHIDQLELEKVRLKKETESYKAVHDQLELQVEETRAQVEACEQEKKNLTAQWEKVKIDLEQKLKSSTAENVKLNSRMAVLEKEIKGHIGTNGELQRKNQALQADNSKFNRELTDMVTQLEVARAEFDSQRHNFLIDRGELEAKVGAIETELGELKVETGRKINQLNEELDNLRVKASEAEIEKKKAEAKLIKFQKAWDQLEG